MNRSGRFPTLLVAGLLTVGAVAVVPPATATAADPCTYCAGGEYHPITPTRIFDSRAAAENDPLRPINDVAPLGAKPAGTANPAFDVQLLGIGDENFANPWLPADVTSNNVLAVVASITVVTPTVRGYLGAYPAGSPSNTSIVNFSANQNVANLSLVRPGDGDFLTVWLHADTTGNAHVIVDVYGWFSTTGYLGADDTESEDERGGRLIPVAPGRIYDSRPASVGPTSVTEVTIRGADTLGASPVTDIVPNSTDVEGVLINLTSTGSTAGTFVSVLPETPVGMPSTSNLNVLAGQTKANLVLVPVGADGKIRLYNHNGSTKLIVDVLGYIERRLDDTRAGRVIPLTSPFRALDTRQAAFGAVPIGPGIAEDWSFAAFSASVNIGGVPVGNQLGLLGNLTNAKLTRQYPTVAVSSYLTVYPTPPTNSLPPNVSSLNSVESTTADAKAVPNMTMVMYGADQKVRVFNYQGYAHYILDVSAVILAD